MLPTKQFERDLADLEPDAFEQLVFAIVRRDHPNAQKLKAPDFGADVLDDPTSRHPRVWQVKHYPGDLHWSDCQESLDRAFRKWRPTEVTFVFPRDLTGRDQQDFTEKLVGRKSVQVTRWTASNLNDALERYPAIRRSFFPHRTDALHEVLRAARLTETPTDGPAFLEHGLKLAELAEELDPHFDYELTARPEHLSRPFSDPTPFMTVRAIEAGRESVLAAFVKPGATPAEPSWSFTEDEAGEAARRALYNALARGDPVELSDGISADLPTAPVAIAKILSEVEREAEARLALQIVPTGETEVLAVSFPDKSGLAAGIGFSMRAAPPKPEDDAAWVGLASGVMLYLGFRDQGRGVAQIEFSPTMDLSSSAGQNALATASMLDLLTEPMRLRGALVAGEADLDLRPITEEDLLERLRFLAMVFEAVIEIEARASVRVQIPDPLGAENAYAALNLADLLRRGHATGRSVLKTTLHVAPDQASPLAMRLSTTRQITVPFEQDLMDQSIRFGWARLTFERVTTTLRPPDASGQAVVRVEASGEIEVRLIEEPLPSDVAMDMVTGNWKSAILG